jgi:hypothetical protein
MSKFHAIADSEPLEDKMRQLKAALVKQYSDSEEPEKIIRENWQNHTGREAFILLTLPLCPAKLTSVFTPRRISRKASGGVLFFWGGKDAS